MTRSPEINAPQPPSSLDEAIATRVKAIAARSLELCDEHLERSRSQGPGPDFRVTDMRNAESLARGALALVRILENKPKESLHTVVVKRSGDTPEDAVREQPNRRQRYDRRHEPSPHIREV